MRSRVVIVARKSDHICVVQDVPDTRGSWYQRQQQSTQSNYSMGSQHSGGSIDQPAPPPAASASAALPALPAPPAAASTSTATTPAATSGGTQPAKPSFAALLGKHPAIKEEPTTPGGTLTSETPPPAGKRSPFRKLSPIAGGGQGEDMSQILSLLTELKTDLTRKFSDLSKRVDSMDASLGKVSQQVEATATSSSASVISSSATRHRPPLEPQQQQQQTTATNIATKATPTSSQPTSSTAASLGSARRESLKAEPPPAAEPVKRRERSKSPHHSKHHHHHHHHRKATHPTPSATPTVSQTDLRDASAPSQTQQETSALGQTRVSAGEGSSSLLLKGVGESGKRMQPAQPADQQQLTSRLMGPPTRTGGSFEQSDDDQDATSKL